MTRKLTLGLGVALSAALHSGCLGTSVCAGDKCIPAPGDGGTDAGTDGGTSCLVVGCDPGFHCNQAGGGSTPSCTPLLIGVTLTTAKGSSAQLVPYGATSAAQAIVLGLNADKTALPRFSADGQTAIWVEAVPGNAQQLRQLSTTGLTAGDAGGSLFLAATFSNVVGFQDLSFAPGPGPLWANEEATSVDGVAWAPLGTQIVSTDAQSGRAPDFSPQNRVVYQADGGGILVFDGSASSPFAAVGFSPRWSPTGDRIACITPKPSTPTPGPYANELSVFTYPGKGGGVLVPATFPADGGLGHFVDTLAWAPDGKRLAFGNGTSQVTDGGIVALDFTVMVQGVNPDGTSNGEAVPLGAGRAPSFSPNNDAIVWVDGAASDELVFQSLDSTGALTGVPTRLALPASVMLGPNGVPRWQPE